MNLSERINEDIKAAMKAKEKEKLEALRAVKSAFLLTKTEKGGGEELSDEKAINIIQKLVKQRKESADIYQKNDREELAEKEIYQAKILEQYLPSQLSEEEVVAAVLQIIEQTGASSMKDMGKVMGIANGKLAGKADGKKIAEIVRSELS